MKLILASTLGVFLSASAWAQHGASAGHAAAGHASGGFSAGRSFAAPRSFASGPVRSSGRLQAYRPNFSAQQRSYPYSSAVGPPPFGATQPPSGNRGGYPNGRYRPYYSRGLYAFPYLLGGGFYDYGFPADDSDYGYPADSSYQQGGYQQNVAPDANAYGQAPPPGSGYEQAYGQMPPPPPGYQPQATPAPAPDIQKQPETTLMFKDGRPPQQVRNYAVTPTTLYILDGGRRREIPLNQIDLPLTEKTNRDAGVDFDVPLS